MNELERTAIRKFPPIFNTSIPSRLKSKSKVLKITYIARVFEGQNKNCTAFEAENLKKQANEVEKNQFRLNLKKRFKCSSHLKV